MEPVAPPPRTITVHFTARDGRTYSVIRRVWFVKGFGHYIKWNRKTVIVDPMATSLTVTEARPPSWR